MTARLIGDVAGEWFGRRKTHLDPDHPTDPVRKHSYREDTAKAQPWLRHRPGGGSRPRWNKMKAAVLGTFDRKIARQRVEATDARRAGDPIEHRLRGDDRLVLFYMLDRYNHVTGMLYPTIREIAARTGLGRTFVCECLARLRHWGFISWVRRTKDKEGADGQAGPQLEQTSNAFYFAWADTLAGELRATFLNLVAIGMKAIAAQRPAGQPPRPSDPATAAALDRIEAGLRARASEGSASP